MTDQFITRKDLLKKLDRVKLNDWIKAAQSLGFCVTQPQKGSSHYAIRLQGFVNEDIRGLVTVVYENLHRQDKPKVFRRIITKGMVTEDDLWKALGMLK